MIEKEIVIGSTNGDSRYMTPWLVQMANRYSSTIHVCVDGWKVNMKSIMGMLSLGLKSNDVFTLSIVGVDEKEAFAAIEHFLS